MNVPRACAFRAAAILTICMPATIGHAQQRAGAMAAGVQFGKPGGVSVKRYRKPDVAFEGLASWNLSDFFFFAGHALRERGISASPLGYYFGPGVAAGVRRKESRSDFVLGVGGTFGVHFFANRYEVFLQANPRLDLLPGAVGRLGGSLGVRYYFRK